jgi:hypothetical protein
MAFDWELWQKRHREKIFRHKRIEDRFTEIYNLNSWGNEESRSGDGSTLACTENLRKNLPILFKKFSITSLFDGPCGDFHWMKYVVNDYPLDYTGGDIVLPMIENNNKKFKSENVRFIHIDLTKESFPKADLMICRDCFFHLSDENIKSILLNFVKSDIKYLLTTNHVNFLGFANRNVVTGSFRLIDLYSEPYNFPKNPLFRISDSKVQDLESPFEEREMCLWSREQIVSVIDNKENFKITPPDPQRPL